MKGAGSRGQGAVADYASRDWSRTSAAKAEHWAQQFKRDRQATWDASQALLAHVRSIRPDFPADEDRDADLRAHRALCAKFDRVADALTRR